MYYNSNYIIIVALSCGCLLTSIGVHAIPYTEVAVLYKST